MDIMDQFAKFLFVILFILVFMVHVRHPIFVLALQDGMELFATNLFVLVVVIMEDFAYFPNCVIVPEPDTPTITAPNQFVHLDVIILVFVFCQKLVIVQAPVIMGPHAQNQSVRLLVNMVLDASFPITAIAQNLTVIMGPSANFPFANRHAFTDLATFRTRVNVP